MTPKEPKRSPRRGTKKNPEGAGDLLASLGARPDVGGVACPAGEVEGGDGRGASSETPCEAAQEPPSRAFDSETAWRSWKPAPRYEVILQRGGGDLYRRSARTCDTYEEASAAVLEGFRGPWERAWIEEAPPGKAR